MGLLEKAKTKAQHGVLQGQAKLGEVQAHRALDRLYRDLGAAYYAEQRSSGDHTKVTAGLEAVDPWLDMHPKPTGP